MSKASSVMSEVLTLVSSTLGANYSQHVRGFDIETLPVHQLENRYSAIFEEISEDGAKVVGRLVVSRNLVLTVTYRTFQSANDSKSGSVLSTIYTNEEALMLAIRTNQFSGAMGQVLEVVDSAIEPFAAENESFLKNVIRFRIRYYIN